MAAFDSAWLDKMVIKLQSMLAKQIKRAEEALKKEDNDPNSRAADARTLASLERMLERLAAMEQARALVRESKLGKENPRDALERRLDKLAAATEPQPDSGKP
ncbi:MAG: hypothetical protein JO256_11225 [Alphaproteobacteria bacterium]|nr:hypothetical protein [Alphaproteobacteria bacterium]